MHIYTFVATPLALSKGRHTKFEMKFVLQNSAFTARSTVISDVLSSAQLNQIEISSRSLRSAWIYPNQSKVLH